MTAKHLAFSALFSAFSVAAFSQEKSIDTVYIFDNQLRNSTKFQKIEVLKEEDLLRNTTNLSEVLRFQSPVYIKENGRGMVSSPSFRGTTAQQTAFVWNGININSVFLGQGDINNINLLGFDDIQIKSGGGSVIYGSGAIGGTIHLNNELTFNKGFASTLFVEGGSFNTFNSFLKTSYSDEKLSVKVSGNFVQSDNDYDVREKNYRNLNGEYDNRTFNLGAAYKVNEANTVSWQTQLFDGEQHYPTSEFGTKTKYLSTTFRTLLDWNYKNSKIKNSFKTAFLKDDFQYFENIDHPKSSGGVGETYLIKNDFNYILNSEFAVNFIGEYQLNKGEGFQSGIGSVKRNAGSAAVLARWNPVQKLNLEVGLKKDFVEEVESPLLFSFSGKIKVNQWYSAALNLSKNFRYPSFNDLYWEPGGNLDLKPEVSHQAELGNNFQYKNFRLNVTPYYIKIRNMIRWLPTNDGYWTPLNTNNVESYGVESQLDFLKNFGLSKTKLSIGYVFTHSKNTDTDQFLMYVPQHKMFGTAVYQYRFAEIFFQGMYNGLTYTTSNETMKDAINPYFVLNGGLNLSFLKNYKIGFKVNNIFDEIYETTANFPLPKRNYSANLLINF